MDVQGFSAVEMFEVSFVFQYILSKRMTHTWQVIQIWIQTGGRCRNLI